MANKPDFNDPSWDTTWWSLWGLLYTGAASDQAMKNAISQRFGDTRAELNKLGPQVDPLASTVANWRRELGSYARTIRFGEAQDVLDRLNALYGAISQQVLRDAQMIASGKKPAKKKSSKQQLAPVTSSSITIHDDSDDTDELSDDDAAWIQRYSNTVLGHSAATAKDPPKQAAKPWVPPTPEETWRDEQRAMASRCDNGINFGAHDVDQDSVLRRLILSPGDGGVKQYRAGPENTHERVMVSRNGVQYWTLGLTHREKRDAGDFSVYRRDGHKSKFDFVNGRRHPKDPGK